jgi:hypothetical protein
MEPSLNLCRCYGDLSLTVSGCENGGKLIFGTIDVVGDDLGGRSFTWEAKGGIKVRREVGEVIQDWSDWLRQV